MASPTLRFPASRMVETRPRIDAAAIARLRPVGSRLGPEGLRLELNVLGEQQSVRLFPTPWLLKFECPSCRRRVRYLYELELRCQECEGLDWAARHGSARSQPLAWKAWSLRRELGGVDEHLFGILPQIPVRHVRRRRLAQQIIEAEDMLLREGHARTVALMRRAIGAGWRPGKPTSRKARSKPKTEHYQAGKCPAKTGQ